MVVYGEEGCAPAVSSLPSSSSGPGRGTVVMVGASMGGSDGPRGTAFRGGGGGRAALGAGDGTAAGCCLARLSSAVYELVGQFSSIYK